MSTFIDLRGKSALITSSTRAQVGHYRALRELGAQGTTTARTGGRFPEELFVAADLTTAEGCAALVKVALVIVGDIDIPSERAWRFIGLPVVRNVRSDEEWKKEPIACAGQYSSNGPSSNGARGSGGVVIPV